MSGSHCIVLEEERFVSVISVCGYGFGEDLLGVYIVAS